METEGSVAAGRMAWMDGGEGLWWHGIPSTPERVVPERDPHSSGVFPRAQTSSSSKVCKKPFSAGGGFLRYPCDLWGLRAANTCSRALWSDLGWAFWFIKPLHIRHSACLMLPGEVQDILPCTQRGNLHEENPPFCSPKAISQPHRRPGAVGIKGTHSVVHSERTHGPLQAFCHLCHCSKCDEAIFVCQKKKYLFGVVFLAAKHIVSSLCWNSGF